MSSSLEIIKISGAAEYLRVVVSSACKLVQERCIPESKAIPAWVRQVEHEIPPGPI